MKTQETSEDSSGQGRTSNRIEPVEVIASLRLALQTRDPGEIKRATQTAFIGLQPHAASAVVHSPSYVAPGADSPEHHGTYRFGNVRLHVVRGTGTLALGGGLGELRRATLMDSDERLVTVYDEPYGVDIEPHHDQTREGELLHPSAGEISLDAIRNLVEAAEQAVRS